ncbi:MAG: lactonase family protein [Rariglobus sp.]|nr:lactonase family protein [Rariglobus sp.]
MRPVFLLSLLLMTLATSSARELFVYVGTYTKTSKGIYVGRFDTETGKLGDLTLAAEAANPSFLALSPDRRFLYAVSEGAGATFNGKPSGTVLAYAVNADTGVLTLINSAASAGRGPCHLTVTPDGKAVLVANYSEGTVALLPVQPDGGVGAPASFDQHAGKSIHPSRQKGPYAHSINTTADGRFAFAADLGTDKIYTYRVDTAAATLTPTSAFELPPGSGPRHLALSSDNRHAYVINELSNTITTCALDPQTGVLTALQTVSTLPADFTTGTTAEIVVHPSGRFVYGSNRGHDSIATFTVDPVTATLTPAGHVSTQGRTPRNFSLSPDGRWLIAANQDGNSLVIYSIDAKSGVPSPTGQTLSLGAPVCVRFY